MKFFLTLTLLLSTLSSVSFAQGYGSPEMKDRQPSKDDFLSSKNLEYKCSVVFNSNGENTKACVKRLEGYYISSAMGEEILTECFGLNSAQIDQSNCLIKYNGKYFPKSIERACSGIKLALCYEKYQDKLIDFPKNPNGKTRSEIVADVIKNIEAGNYVKARSMLAQITKEQDKKDSDNCTNSSVINDSNIKKLNSDVDKINDNYPKTKTLNK